jgi:hypothetical protein
MKFTRGSGQRESKPNYQFRDSAQFRGKSAAICALTAHAEISDFAESRRFTQFYCPNLSEKFSLLFRRFRGCEFLEARINASFVIYSTCRYREQKAEF